MIKQNELKLKGEKIIEKVFLISACITIISMVLITIFIFTEGGPAIFKIGVVNFLFGKEWEPVTEIFGILPMIIGSLLAVIGAILVSVPIGIFTAIFTAEIAPNWLIKIIETSVELLASIPSVVYGFFGLSVIVPMIDKLWGGGGNSLLAVIIILAIMILPTIMSISENSIKSVPKEYREASLAMGVSQVQTIFKVVLPSAKSGITAALILGIGRAIGETMAVILVAGNTPLIPNSLLSRVRTMTANIAIEMGYAYGLHQEALFATGVVLFVFIMLLNMSLNILNSKVGE